MSRFDTSTRLSAGKLTTGKVLPTILLMCLIILYFFSSLAMANIQSCPECQRWNSQHHQCEPIECGNCAKCVNNNCVGCDDIPNYFCCGGGCYPLGDCWETAGGSCRKCGGRPCEWCNLGVCTPSCNPAMCQSCNVEGGYCDECDIFLESCCSNGVDFECYDNLLEACCNGKKYFYLTHGCCNGEIYDRSEKKCCSEQWLCDKDKECCNGNCCGECEECIGGLFGSYCVSCEALGKTCCDGHCCNPANCESCVDGQCKECGGDPNQKCCNGSCVESCEEVGSETVCSSENNISCPACVGISGNCSGSKARYYTNATIYNCSGGCPGPPPDCDYEDPAPICYDTYFCTDYIHYTFAKCTIYPHEPGDIYPPETGPLECYGRDYVWGCTRCQQGSLDNHWPVVSKRCQ